MNGSGSHPAFGEKVQLFGVGITLTDYADATDRIIAAASARQSYAVSALAVHGLMEAVGDDSFNEVVESIDLVAPDGQPVRWALNAVHGVGLEDRVSGPHLVWRVLERAEEEAIGVYLYGSTPEVCEGFATEIRRRHPGIRIVGVQPDRFRDATPEEDGDDIRRITQSGAGVVLVGRGCPRQERWVSTHRGEIPAAMLAVGAAFDYGAGSKKEPPMFIQRAGLHWAWRLAEDPRRLWKRYLVTNSAFLLRLARELAQSRTVRQSERR